MKCAPCNVGSYSADPGSVQCQQCPQGMYANTTGMAICYQCPTNTIPKPDKSGCQVIAARLHHC